jgi:hypothetical protein
VACWNVVTIGGVRLGTWRRHGTSTFETDAVDIVIVEAIAVGIIVVETVAIFVIVGASVAIIVSAQLLRSLDLKTGFPQAVQTPDPVAGVVHVRGVGVSEDLINGITARTDVAGVSQDDLFESRAGLPVFVWSGYVRQPSSILVVKMEHPSGVRGNIQVAGGWGRALDRHNDIFVFTENRAMGIKSLGPSRGTEREG